VRRYESPAALRMALGHHLRSDSQESGISVERLRRRVMYERIVVRLDLAEPGMWVVRGGLALDVRLGRRARASMDLDLGLRENAIEGDRLRDRMIEALETDPDEDWFTFFVGRAEQLQADQGGRAIWRYSVRPIWLADRSAPSSWTLRRESRNWSRQNGCPCTTSLYSPESGLGPRN